MRLLSLCRWVLLPLSVLSADLTLILPRSGLLPDPSQLPPSTSATIARLGSSSTALLTRRNTFEFTDLTVGSYLLTVACRDFTFQPLRVDVTTTGEGAEEVDVWQTFWGNEWENKGERRGGGAVKEGTPIKVHVSPVAEKNFYAARTGFAILDILKSPMILLAIASLALIVGLPYITENMDEETKAEFEAMQGKSPLATLKSPATEFDLAGWMAGKK